MQEEKRENIRRETAGRAGPKIGFLRQEKAWNPL